MEKVDSKGQYMIIKGHTIMGQPALIGSTWDKVEAECAKHPRFVIEVRKYSEAKEWSLEQFAYLHAVVFPALATHMGVSNLMAETILKKKCGEEWFIQDVDGNAVIISKTSLSKKAISTWMENIWDFMETIGCPVPPPDKDWRALKAAEDSIPF